MKWNTGELNGQLIKLAALTSFLRQTVSFIIFRTHYIFNFKPWNNFIVAYATASHTDIQRMIIVNSLLKHTDLLKMNKKNKGCTDVFTQNVTSLHFSLVRRIGTRPLWLKMVISLWMCPPIFADVISLRLWVAWPRLDHLAKWLGIRRAAMSPSPWTGLLFTNSAVSQYAAQCDGSAELRRYLNVFSF